MSTVFSITTLPLSRGLLALAPLPGIDGDLGGDLDRIADWHPDLIVTLTEPGEMKALNAGRLPKRMTQRALPWAAFAIPDFGTPPAGADWATLGAAVHGILDRGGRVLVHCRGGLGRSGMIALRLMVEHGEDPGAALARLRAARPGAVETEAQLQWATDIPA
jgi:protein-tyrosine phosphatase